LLISQVPLLVTPGFHFMGREVPTSFSIKILFVQNNVLLVYPPVIFRVGMRFVAVPPTIING